LLTKRVVGKQTCVVACQHMMQLSALEINTNSTWAKILRPSPAWPIRPDPLAPKIFKHSPF